MTKYTFISTILLLSALTFQCKKSKTEVAPTSKIDVSQITYRDNYGIIYQAEDTTDWTLDHSWSDEEFALFQTPASSDLAGAEKAEISDIAAYPNPSTSNSYISLIAYKKTYLQVVITDNMLVVKDRFIFKTAPGQLPIDFTLSKYLTNTNYRVYYGFYSAQDGLYYKGHGDIKISK